MKILHRYIFFSVFSRSLFSVGLFVFVLLTGNAIKDIAGLLANGQITFFFFAKLLGLLVPFVVSYALPIGILTGVLVVLGRMSSRREITAMKSAGLSLWYISAGIMGVALAGVAVSTFINCFYAPAARSEYRSMLRGMVQEDPLRFLSSGQFTREFPGYILYITEQDENILQGLWIWEMDDQKRVVKLVRADRGIVLFDEAENSLILTLQDGSTELRDENNPDSLQPPQPVMNFQEARIRLPLDRFLGNSRDNYKISYMDLFQLIAYQHHAIENAQLASGEAESGQEETLGNFLDGFLFWGATSGEVAVIDGKRMVVGNEGETGDESYWRGRERKAGLQLHKNLATAFSIIPLAMISIPLGIKASRSETYANAALALFLALGYYFLIIAMDWFEKIPSAPLDFLVWLPNLIFECIGIILILRANRH